MNKIKEIIKELVNLINSILEHYIEFDMCDSKKNNNE
jgi:hypothetical protein